MFSRIGISILALSLTFALGIFTANRIHSKEANISEQDTSHPTRTARESKKRLNTFSEFSFLTKGASNTDLLSEITIHQNSISRSKALLALIDTLGPNDFHDVVRGFEESGLVELRRPEYELLLSAWAQAAPEDAIEYASKQLDGVFAKNIVLETWATTDPEAALTWAQNNFASPDIDEANPWVLGIIRGIVAKDLDAASSIFESIPRDSPEQREALTSILSHLHATDPKSAQKWAFEIKDEEIRSMALGVVTQKMVLTNPAEAARWVASLKDPTAFSESAQKIAHHYYLESPEETKKWITDLPVWAVGEAANAVVNLTTQENPEAAAQWMSDLLEANPNGNYDPAIETLIEKSVLVDPLVSAEWVIGLTSERQQNKHYQTVISEWLEKDEQAARDWVQYRHQDLPESVLLRFFPDFIPEVDIHNLDESNLNSQNPTE